MSNGKTLLVSTMGLECKSCGEKAVELEDNGSGEQQICRACGAVCSDCALLNDREFLMKKPENLDRYFGDRLPRQYTRYQFTKKSESYNSGRKLVRSLSSALCLKPSIVDESLGTFEKVFQLYIHTHFETKLYLASWCVYIVCRQAGLPITAHYISHITGYPVHKVYQYHANLLEKLGIQLIHQDITELIESTLKLELVTDIQCSCETKEKTRDIILLCKDLWLIEGRNPHAAILAAFFIAWQSENFAVRKKTNVNKLCKRRPLVTLCNKRLKEFRDTLCKLARSIPWVTEVKRDNLPYYITDVLKYQRSLVIDVMRKAQCGSHTNNENDVYQADPFLNHAVGIAKQSTTVETTGSEQKQVKSNSENLTALSVCTSTSKKEECSCSADRNFIEKLDNKTSTKETTVDVAGRHVEVKEQNIEQECIFTPPAFKKARRKSLNSKTIQEYIEHNRSDKK